MVANVLNSLEGRSFQGGEAVELAKLNRIPNLLIVSNVPGDFREFFIGSPVQVDADPQGAAHGIVHAERERQFPLVHAEIIGEPGPHVFDGIKITVSFLDEKPVERICVVAGPVLVEALQRAVIHPASAGSARPPVPPSDGVFSIPQRVGRHLQCCGNEVLSTDAAPGWENRPLRDNGSCPI